MGSREDITRAVVEGAEAGHRGDRLTTCPYPADTLLRAAWIRGYATVRPLTEQRAE